MQRQIGRKESAKWVMQEAHVPYVCSRTCPVVCVLSALTCPRYQSARLEEGIASPALGNVCTSLLILLKLRVGKHLLGSYSPTALSGLYFGHWNCQSGQSFEIPLSIWIDLNRFPYFEYGPTVIALTWENPARFAFTVPTGRRNTANCQIQKPISRALGLINQEPKQQHLLREVTEK